MKRYWKVRTSHERKDSDLHALYGGSRYFKNAIDAEHRCQELNEAKDQLVWLVGSFYFQERFVRGGMPEDNDVDKVFLDTLED